MWGPRTGDTLLPKSVYAALPNLVMDRDLNELYEKDLKVVAIRLDPCFREGDEPCRRQVRLVWQPVVVEEGTLTTLDAAVHTFYQLSESQWAKLVKELPASESGDHLTVHPRLAREGYRGETWQKLGFLLGYCNPVTLVRATAMTVNPLGNIWFFSGLNLQDGHPRSIQIPRVRDTVQGFFTSLERRDTDEFRVAMNPAPPGKESLLLLLNNSRVATQRLGEEEIREATRESLALQNPRLTHPGSVDCASCHSAHLVPSWSMRNFRWDWETIFPRELFAGDDGRKFLPEKKTMGPDVLRMFGYFERDPVIARRVEFETKEALKRM